MQAHHRMLFLFILTALQTFPAAAQWSPSTPILPDTLRPFLDFEDGPPPPLYTAATDPQGNIYLAWGQDLNGVSELYFSRFEQGAWSAPVNVSHSAVLSTFPELLIDQNGTLHTFWTEWEDSIKILYSFSENGTNWTQPAVISDRVAAIAAFPVAVLAPDGSLHCFWTEYSDNGNNFVYKIRSAGGVWSARQAIPSTSNSALRPQVLLDANGTLHCVWFEDSSISQRGIAYSSRKLNGPWSPPYYIATGSVNDDRPISLAADPYGRLHIGWLGAALMTAHQDSSAGWTPPVQLAPQGLSPSFLSTTDGAFHAIWQSEGEIRYAQFDLETDRWQDAETLIQDERADFPVLIQGEMNMLYAFFLTYANANQNAGIAYTARQLQLASSTPDVPQSPRLTISNYPNPFNPSTTIHFTLPKAGQVEITLFNPLGQQVELLLDEFLPAGEHNIVFHADHLASGLYLCSIRSGRHIQTRKMVLVR